MVHRGAGLLRVALLLVGVSQQSVCFDAIGLLVGTLGIRLGTLVLGALERGLHCGG